MLRLIGGLKLVKALTLLAAGVGILSLGNHGGHSLLWQVQADPGNHYVNRVIAKLASASPHKIHELGAGLFVYAALFGTEGVGLWMRKLWAEPVVTHEDRDHRIDRAGILPRPKRQIPIWFGGSSEAAYDRAARIGDGFLFGARTQTEAVQNKARIETKVRGLGRDADTFGFESVQQYSRGDNQWPGDIAAWREAGGSHISVVTMGANLTTVDGHINAIKRWRDVYNSVR